MVFTSSTIFPEEFRRYFFVFKEEIKQILGFEEFENLFKQKCKSMFFHSRDETYKFFIVLKT